MEESDRLRIHNLLTDALVEREKFSTDPGDEDLYVYFDGKVSGLREALGLPIEDNPNRPGWV